MLEELGIPFIRNYKVWHHETYYFFDFFVDNKYFIEYDGEQHFNYRETGWNDLNNHIETTKRDNKKNAYCFLKRIPLIRIPFNEKYEPSDLVLDTSRYILTEDNIINYYHNRK